MSVDKQNKTRGVIFFPPGIYMLCYNVTLTRQSLTSRSF